MHPDTPAPRRPAASTAPWCALVGAGPGDPELLTVKALRTLRSADLLLVDDLVGAGVLPFALRGLRRPPRVVQVGKRGGCASTPQDFIQRLMVTQALAGQRVVRLKGGDPFVFGRGGEEAQALRQHGITVEVVSGITAGVAAAAALGLPLTHRDHAQGVILVTGHPRRGGQGLDWPALGAAAAQGLTLVVYMGIGEVQALSAGLARSLPGDTPVAVVQSASLPTQRQLHSSLAALVGDLAASGLGSPAVVIVGDVLRGRLALQAAAHDAVASPLRASPVPAAAGA